MTVEDPEVPAASPAEIRIAQEFAHDLERLKNAVAKLRENTTEAETHEFRVAVTALVSNLDTNKIFLKRRAAMQLTSDLILLTRFARKARSVDVKYQQVLAMSLDTDESTQAALQPTVAVLSSKRSKARQGLSDLLRTAEFAEIFDSVVVRVEVPAVRRSWVGALPAAVEAQIATNQAEAVERFRKLMKVSRRKDSQRKLHNVRMAAKRVRYGLEGLEGESDNCELARMTQSTLGSIRDAEVLIAWLAGRLEKRTTTKLERHAIAVMIDAEKSRLKRLETKFKTLRKSVS